MNLAAVQIPPPKDWQAFERLCADLWRKEWNDPNAQMNGRGGQQQNGVDVFGQHNSTGPYHGVQCKGKDGAYGGAVTEKELRDEVDKAKGFEPKISSFVLATTAPNDAKIQKVARDITVENEKEGLFSVAVLGWDEIQLKIASYPDVVTKHYPTFLYNTGNLQERESALPEQGEPSAELIAELTAKLVVDQLQPTLAAPPVESPVNDAEAQLNKEIDKYRELIAKQPEAALTLFQELHSSNPTVSAETQFRILANIGASHLELDSHKEASDFFIRAGECIPEQAKGVSKIAFGNLLGKDFPKALEYANKAIEIDSEIEEAYTVLAVASCEVHGPHNLEESIPDEQKQSPHVAFSLGQAFMRNDMPDKAVYWLERAAEGDGGSMESRAAYGEALLAQSYSELRDNSGEIPPEVLKRLEKARDLIQGVWREVEFTDRAKRFAYAAANLAHIFNLLSAPDEAEKTLDRVFQFFPNLPGARKLAAGIRFNAKDVEAAKEHLSFIPEGSDSEADLMRVETVAKAGDPSGALSLLKTLKLPPEFKNLRASSQILEVAITLDLYGAEKALEIADSVLESEPANIPVLLEKARILGKIVAKDSAKETILLAVEAVNEDTLPHQIIEIADILYQLDMSLEASEMYGKAVQLTSDTRALRNYLGSLYDADNREKFNEVISLLPDGVLNHPYYIRLVGYFYLLVGDLEKARECFEDYLDNHKDTLAVRLAWLQVLQRQMDEDTIKAFCASDPVFPDASPTNTLHLVHVVVKYGNPAHALKMAYQVSRKNPRSSEALHGYTSLLLVGGLPEHFFEVPVTIDEDACFSIRNEHGEVRQYTIEMSWDGDLADDQILADHPIAAKCMGKRLGDSIEIDGAFQQTRWEITHITNKFVQWHEAAIQKLQAFFPGDSGFEMVNIRKEGEEYDFSVIFKSLDDKRAASEQVIENYKNHPMPVGLFAELVGADSLEAWVGLRSSTPIICCAGVAEERDSALNLLDGDNKYIVDPLTLYTAYKLDILDEIMGTLQDLGIAQSSLDLFTNKIIELEGRSGGFLASDGEGKYVITEYSDEQRDAEIKVYKEILQWVEANCVVVPALGRQPTDASWVEFKEKLEPWFSDTFLAADYSGRNIFSEDMRYRQLAKGVFGIDGVWIQAVLIRAVELEVMSPQKYSEAVADLILANHTLIAVAPPELVMLLESNGWEESDRFLAAVGCLKTETLEIKSIIMVAAQFIQIVWVKRLPNRIRLTNLMMNNLIAGRAGNAAFIIRALARVFGYLPKDVQAPYLRSLETWAVGHMIVPAGGFRAFLEAED